MHNNNRTAELIIILIFTKFVMEGWTSLGKCLLIFQSPQYFYFKIEACETVTQQFHATCTTFNDYRGER